MIVNSFGMRLEDRHSVTLSVSRSNGWGCLDLTGNDTHCEIWIDPAHVRALGDQVPAALADLARRATENEACAQAETARDRTVDAAAKALDLATAAEAAGAHDLAASLRQAATDATETANAVDSAVEAFETATTDADDATEQLITVTHDANAALRGLGNNDRPITALVDCRDKP